jgi:hypothetical protein
MKIGDIVKINTELFECGWSDDRLLFFESWIGIVTAVLEPIHDEPMVMVQWSHMTKPNPRPVCQLKHVEPERR